ncbi:hypothetical protein DSO57_1018004 [Entomophthora muscae]|uniref:Uncharacterized protein n=1 Tax=Entomophthora muscae TaxID=34485 RepID=A0ACC2TF90_9FUNG|nr:hypothetical protein DSO57_1018004 [Entomophthora muscae]
MGIASYRVFRKGRDEGINVKPALTAYAVQLFFNAVWTSLFFRFQSRFIALIDITIVIGTVILTIVLFEQVDDKAAQLMLPYLFWIVISGYLNKAVWRLNQGRAYIDVRKLKKNKKVAKKVVETSEEESEAESASESESEAESEAESESEVESEVEVKPKAKAKKTKVETESEPESESESEKETVLKKRSANKKGRGKFKCGNCGVDLEV